MTIQLHGLTKQQSQIADMIWSCESQEAVAQLIRNLPREYKKDAVVIHELMIAAVIDQHEDIDEATKELIHSIASR